MNRFLSLDSLRAAHSTLMQVHREQSQQDETIPNNLLNQIDTFIEQGQTTGAVLNAEAERVTAQGLLDYWSTILDREGQLEVERDLASDVRRERPHLDRTRLLQGVRRRQR